MDPGSSDFFNLIHAPGDWEVPGLSRSYLPKAHKEA